MAINPYRYSYSGADAKVFAMLSDRRETAHLLESVHTISVSVHEAKGQARALGHRGVKGFSRGVRTIAGSIILTVVEDHPFRKLLSATALYASSYRGGWSMDQNSLGTGTALDNFNFNNRLIEMLPPVDLLIAYVSEGGEFSATVVDPPGAGPVFASLHSYKGAAMMVQGVEFVDSGMITSVNDIVSEITVSFIARDFKPITLNTFEVDDPNASISSAQQYSSMDLRKVHGGLERILYGSYEPPVSDAQLTDPDARPLNIRSMEEEY